MSNFLEIAGIAIICLCLVQAGAAVVYGLRRHARAATAQRKAIAACERHAALVLSEAKVVRDRTLLSWQGLRKLRIDEKITEAEGICSLVLKPHDGKPLPSFRPGQHLTFHLRIPGQEKPAIRCYSLSGSCEGGESYRVSIRREGPRPDAPDLPVGLVSGYIHDVLQEGDIIDVKAPSGHFFLDTNARTPVVLIGGGIGVTPLLSMLEAICRSENRRETWFFYGVRDQSQIIMRDHLLRCAIEHEYIRVIFSLSSKGKIGSADQTASLDHHGRIDIPLLQRTLPSNNYDFYVCGPSSMMSALVPGLKAWGVPRDRIHFEAFGPSSLTPDVETQWGEVEAVRESVPVTFARSDRTVNWTQADGSLLDLAEAQGIGVDSGCRSGSCGSCVTAIREGRVRYTAEPGFVLEEGTCLLCISVPDGPVMLDG